MSDRGKMQIKTDHLQSRDHQPWPQVPENIRVKKAKSNRPRGTGFKLSKNMQDNLP